MSIAHLKISKAILHQISIYSIPSIPLAVLDLQQKKIHSV